MRHNRFIKSKRHRKMKNITTPSDFNFIDDKIVNKY